MSPTRRHSGSGDGGGPPVGVVPDTERSLDRHAHAVLEARLGRPARDVLEATVVLEAWTGIGRAHV